jgi:hypothetical protein
MILFNQFSTTTGTSSSSPQATEHLAQGNDPIELEYSFGAFKSSGWQPDATYSETCTASWNDVFGVVSPLLIDEASDGVLKKALDQFVEDQSLAHLATRKELKGYELKAFKLDDNAFNTIKVQFLALRLMVKSTKRRARSVSDRAAYWMLTPYGESVMMSLRAVRRPLENSDNL